MELRLLRPPLSASMSIETWIQLRHGYALERFPSEQLRVTGQAHFAKYVRRLVGNRRRPLCPVRPIRLVDLGYKAAIDHQEDLEAPVALDQSPAGIHRTSLPLFSRFHLYSSSPQLPVRRSSEFLGSAYMCTSERSAFPRARRVHQGLKSFVGDRKSNHRRISATGNTKKPAAIPTHNRRPRKTLMDGQLLLP